MHRKFINQEFVKGAKNCKTVKKSHFSTLRPLFPPLLQFQRCTNCPRMHGTSRVGASKWKSCGQFSDLRHCSFPDFSLFQISVLRHCRPSLFTFLTWFFTFHFFDLRLLALSRYLFTFASPSKLTFQILQIGHNFSVAEIFYHQLFQPHIKMFYPISKMYQSNVHFFGVGRVSSFN